jgi:hypothetical protein
MKTKMRPLAVVLLSGVALAGLVPTGNAGADGALPSSFELTAVADGIRVATTIPGAPLSDGLVDVSTSSTQAVIDAVGVSRSYAAVPYPGATLTNLPDVLRGASGAPIPSYPFIAAADYPTVPEGTTAQPGVNLKANSGAGRSEGSLVSGGGDDATSAIRTTAHSLVEASPDGALSAEADTAIAGLAVGPLQIGRVTSLARVVRAGAGEPRREQALQVTGLSVAGQAFGIGPQGLVAGPGNVPLPDSHPARAALEQAGIAVRYLEPVETPDGVLSAGLLVSQVIPASPTGQPSRVTYTVGRARAQIVVGAATPAPAPDTASSGVPSPPAADGPWPTDGPPLSPNGALAASGTAEGPPMLGPVGGEILGSGAESAAAPAEPTAASPDAGSAGPSSLHALPAAAPALSFGAGRAAEVWSRGFFGLPLAAGALLLLVFLAVRTLGVKSTWVS